MTDRSAQFSVTPIIEDPQLDRGDDLYLDVYFSGNGDIAHNKLHIQFPFDDVFEEGGSEFIETVGDNGSIDANTERASNVGYTIGLDSAHFEYDESSDSPIEFGRIGGERNHGNNPPLLVRLNTKQDSRPGNYTIPITFTYQDSNENIGQDYKEVSFHVNSWQEENSALIKKIAVVAAAATVLSFIGGPILDILAWAYELLKHSPSPSSFNNSTSLIWTYELLEGAISFYSGVLD